MSKATRRVRSERIDASAAPNTLAYTMLSPIDALWSMAMISSLRTAGPDRA